MTKQEKAILAFFAGAVAGAALGILFAPAKGSETRSKIADSTGKLANNIKEKAKEGFGTISDLREKMFHSENGNGHKEDVI